MAHFRNGQWEYGKSRGKCGRNRSRCRTAFCGTNSCQEGQSQQHQCDVPVPANEAAGLIVVQSTVLSIFKIFFDVPACANSRNHLRQGRCFWSNDEVVRFLVGISEATADEQRVPSIVLPLVQDGHHCLVEEPWPFGSLTHREALPILLVKQEGFHFPDFYSSALSI